MKELLQVISEELEGLNLNYDYLIWKITPISYPYIIGEYYENNYVEEQHKSEGEFLLTIWDRSNSNENLVNVNQTIKNHFRDFKTNKNNTGIYLSYANSLPVLQEDENLRKQEIRLDVQYWEGV